MYSLEAPIIVHVDEIEDKVTLPGISASAASHSDTMP